MNEQNRKLYHLQEGLMSKSRFEAFTDGVFAIAITLLVLEIHVPELKDPTNAAMIDWFKSLGPSLSTYVLSFLTVGVIWLNHHATYKQIKYVDRTMNLLNLILLLTVCFVPYPTALLAKYGPLPASTAFYATPAAPPTIPANFDPCGGPTELFNKLGNATACVFVSHEFAANVNYATFNIPANATITGPFGRSTSVSGQTNAYSYPASTIYAGVGPRSQVSFTPPTFTSVNTRGGVTQGGTDMTFAYKQLFLLSMQKFTMLGVNLAYAAPTAGDPFGAVGPKYTIDPILTQPLPKNFGFSIASPIANFSTSSTVCPSGPLSCHGVIGPRAWSWTPQFFPYWVSPGGTMIAGFIQHGFNPNTWPAGISLSQLLNRHVEIYVLYGGANETVTATGPVFGAFQSSANVTPTGFMFGIAALAGQSDLPPALLQAMAPASPTPSPTPTK